MDVDKAIRQILDYYKSSHEDAKASRQDKILHILGMAEEPLTSAEFAEILEVTGDPVSRMTVQRSIIRLIREDKIEYKGRAVRLDVTGKKMYIPTYGLK